MVSYQRRLGAGKVLFQGGKWTVPITTIEQQKSGSNGNPSWEIGTKSHTTPINVLLHRVLQGGVALTNPVPESYRVRWRRGVVVFTGQFSV